MVIFFGSSLEAYCAFRGQHLERIILSPVDRQTANKKLNAGFCCELKQMKSDTQLVPKMLPCDGTKRGNLGTMKKDLPIFAL